MRGSKVTNGFCWRVAARVLRFLRTRLGVSTVVVLTLLAYGAWSRPVFPDSVDGPLFYFQQELSERYWSATEQQRLSPQWTRDLIFDVAGEERRVVRGWVHRVRVSIVDENHGDVDGRSWPGTVARERESNFPPPPCGKVWIVVHETARWYDYWSRRRNFGYGKFELSVQVAPDSWMARLSHYVWPFVPWRFS